MRGQVVHLASGEEVPVTDLEEFYPQHKKFFHNPRGTHIQNPARFRLDASGYKLFVGKNQQILRYYEKMDMEMRDSDNPAKYFRFPLNQNKTGEDITLINIPYERLKRFGLKIIEHPTNTYKSIFGISKLYYIASTKESRYQSLFELPANIHIQFDVKKKLVRLLSRNCVDDGGHSGYTQWVKVNKNLTNEDFVSGDPLTTEDNMFNRLVGNKMAEKMKYINLSEDLLPILITSVGELLCIPDTGNPPVVGRSGQRGSGKTFSFYGEMEQIYWRWRWRCGNLNDVNDESYAVAKPVKTNSKGASQLSQYNMSPCGLPMVYLHNNHRTLYPEQIHYRSDLGFQVALKVADIIETFEAFQENFNLPTASLTHLRRLGEMMSGFKDRDGLKAFLEENIESKNKDTITAAIMRVMDVFYKEQLLDVNTGVASEWIVRTPEGKNIVAVPFLACLMTGVLIPNHVNFHMKSSPYLKSIFFKSAAPIFRFHTENLPFRKTPTMLYCDEITTISDTTTKKDKATEILNSIVREGRPVNIGFSWATNMPSKVPDTIYNNTTHYFVFRSKLNDAKSAIDSYLGGSNKSMYRTVVSEMPRHHCAALTTESFVLCDEDGESTVGEGEYIVGKSIPRLSRHPTLTIRGQT